MLIFYPLMLINFTLPLQQCPFLWAAVHMCNWQKSKGENCVESHILQRTDAGVKVAGNFKSSSEDRLPEAPSLRGHQADQLYCTSINHPHPIPFFSSHILTCTSSCSSRLTFSKPPMSSHVTCGTSTTVSRSADGLLWPSAHYEGKKIKSTACRFNMSICHAML